MASALAAAPHQPRAGERLLRLAFAVGVGAFFWAFVAGFVYLISLGGGLPFRSDHLAGARQRGVRGDLAGALRQYRVAALIDPTDVRALNEMGELLLRAGRYGDAAFVYERSLQLAPEQPFVLNDLGRARALSGDLARAIDAFEAALALAPESPAQANLQRARAEQQRLRKPER